MAQFLPGQRIHFVGIGGAGLSAIARILVERGFAVSGSDRNMNELMKALAGDGATIHHGHDATHVQGADMVIITSAVNDDHVAAQAARAAGLPVYKRQDIMAGLMEGQKVIAVAGTKGKTTTTAMIVHILRECGLDPSYIVGGVTGNTGTNAGVGKGEYFIVEADEYDNMFLGLRPDIAVITNIEWDHPDFFKTPDELYTTFKRFVDLLPYDDNDFSYRLIAGVNSPLVRQLIGEYPSDFFITYALAEIPFLAVAQLCATDLQAFSSGQTAFDLYMMDGAAPRFTSRQLVPFSGQHNIANALAALGAALKLGLSLKDAGGALRSFKLPARRFELRADVNRIAIVDDYAHNPMSIRAVLEAARMRYPDRAIWAVWQPHTYSRTQALFDDFVEAFRQADQVLITDIYAARENPIPGVSSAAIVEAIAQKSAELAVSGASSLLLVEGDQIAWRVLEVRHTPTFADVVNALREGVKSPAVVLIMSAGDAPQIGVDYLKWLQDVSRPVS